MKTKFLSRLIAALFIGLASVGFSACGNDDNNDDEPEAPDAWSTAYKFEFEIGDDVFNTADVTAYIASPDGTVSQVPVTDSKVSWTVKGNKIPDKAAVLLTFVPKKSIDVSKAYKMSLKGTVIAESYKNKETFSFKTYPHSYSLDVPGENVSKFWTDKTFGVAMAVDATGNVVSASLSDFDFGFNFILNSILIKNLYTDLAIIPD